jgi:hypothetical protein
MKNIAVCAYLACASGLNGSAACSVSPARFAGSSLTCADRTAVQASRS